jgi:predicted alpha-1,2-mannosidase
MVKSNLKLVGVISFCLLLNIFRSVNGQPVKKPIDYVDPFIGTDFFGDVFPGATLPYSLIHVSPDTHNQGWSYRKGYLYTDNNMMGFSHTHGGGGGGEIMLMPTVHQQLQVVPGDKDKPDKGYRSRFSHDSEMASPGYYQVKLTDYGINVEITATQRAAFHRYTFPGSQFSRIILDLGHDINRKNTEVDAELNIVNDTVIEGWRKSVNTNGNIYFVAHFSKPFRYYGTFDNTYKSPESDAGIYPMKSGEKGDRIGAFVQYYTSANEQVLVKVAISYVNLDGARKNLIAEIPHWDFEKTHRDARKIWSAELERVLVEGATENDRQKFYTAIYRSLVSQYTFQDVDGKYFGMDGKIQTASGYDFYPSFLTWDTFRSQHPLLTLINSDHVNDIMKSVEAKIRQYGWVPGLHAYNRFSQGMIGDHMVPIVVDAYLKGYREFDAEFVYQAMKKKATELPQLPIPPGAAREGLNEYLKLGYVAADKDKESASCTLEFAFDDWCLAQMAKAMGKTDDYNYFMKRGENYVNLWDSETRFMRPRLSTGKFLDRLPHPQQLLETKTEGDHTWYTYFEPLLIGRAPNRHYTESNAWPYTWAVQQDIPGLIRLFGGNEKFNNRLDTFFTMSPCEAGPKYVGTVGTIGQYVHGYQPSHHIAYLYYYSGQPWKTQYYVRYICEKFYKTGAGGLCGNEDMGSLSSWYIFSAMGFYPVTPCSNNYVIGSPTFDRITLKLKQGKLFTIKAHNNSKSNIYIQSATLNGKTLTKTWLSHQEITDGGSLIFEMGPKPNLRWGAYPEDVPPPTTIN